MKKIIILFTAASLLLTGCWKEEIPSAGSARHQVEDLKAVPGDEEVALSWSIPEGWNPTEYVISYTSGEAVSVTTTETSYLVEGLENGVSYTFGVQARYGNEISGVVSVIAKPATSRIPVAKLTALAFDSQVELSWDKPSTSVKDYTLSWYKSSAAADVKTATIAASETSYTVSSLENDNKYVFTIIANYPKGSSTPTTVEALPALAIPFLVSTSTAVVNQPVTFTFNSEAYPSATDPKWTFPGDDVKNGAIVEYAFGSEGKKEFVLSCTLSGKTKEWSGSIDVREYTVKTQDFSVASGQKYNGFKGAAPVFSPDGKTVYMITFNKLTSLLAFDIETGEKKWNVDFPNGSYNPFCVNPVNGDIYVGTEGGFYAVTAAGANKWTFESGSNSQSAGPAVSKDGQTVYNINAAGTVVALNAETGSKKWEQALGERGAALLVNGDELVVGTQGHFWFLKVSDGSKIGDGIAQTATAAQACGFAVSADGKYAYYGATNAVGILNIETKTLGTTLAVGSNVNWQPVVAPNGDVFIGSKDGFAYCMDRELSAIKWSLDSGAGTNAFNFSHPCVTTENYYIITSGQALNKTFVLDASGNQVAEPWSYTSTTTQKQMGGNNLLNGHFFSAMIGSGSDNGIFVGKYVGYQKAAGWSTYGGDQCGSNCLK